MHGIEGQRHQPKKTRILNSTSKLASQKTDDECPYSR